MTIQLEKAARLALEALESVYGKGKRCEAAITALRAALEQPAQDEQDRQIDELIKERDHRDEIIDKLCDLVLGPDRYEWSSQYFFEDAVREAEERMAALEQPVQDVDWEKLYRLEVKKKEALAAKYERDTGKKLTYVVPMQQPAQDEPVAIADGTFNHNCPIGVPLYTRPQAREPLTEKRINELYSFWIVDCQDIVGFARAIERLKPEAE